MSFIAKNIRTLRRRLNLSQTAFAEEVGMNRGNIASYEKGTAEPNAAKLLRVARFFGIRLTDLIEKDMEEVVTTSPQDMKGRLEVGLARNPMSGGVENIENWEEFAQKTLRLQKIYDGLRELHLYSAQNTENPENPDRVVYDYERLLEITGELLAINQKLMTS